jgi:hypothetical protein
VLLRHPAELHHDGGRKILGNGIMSKTFSALALVGVLAQGCLMNQTQVAKGGALLHSAFPYAVSYDDEEKKSVLGEEWQLENYRVYKDVTTGQPAFERKDGYSTTYEFDFDDDDKADQTGALPSPDLAFVSRTTNARIEVTTLLLDKRLASKELRVLLNNIVESASGSRSLFVGFGRVAGGVEKRFASRLLESSKATLQNNEGLVATIERADVDQLQLNPNARWRRSRLFLVHAPFEYYVKEDSIGAEARPAQYHKYRVLLLVEYTNTPEDFEAQYPDLLRLLGKLHFLSDDNVLELMGQTLVDCAPDKKGKVELAVDVSETGEASLDQGVGLESLCLAEVLPLFRFAATGKPRTVSRKYDLSRSLKPAWLADSTYAEERAEPASPAPTASEPAGQAAPSNPASESPPTPPAPTDAGGGGPSTTPAAPPPSGGTAPTPAP